MSYEHKNGNGSLFKNEYKKSDAQPDYQGTIKLPDGTDQQISAWVKDGTKGKYFSLKLSAPYVKDESKVTAKGNDDLPF
jgi:uncharacterized protein (DUF736 family)